MDDDERRHVEYKKDDLGNITYSNESLVSLYMRQFGKSAFGIISLLIIWFSIVRPELIYSREQITQLNHVVIEMQKLTLEQSRWFAIIEANQRRIIDNTIKILERHGRLGGGPNGNGNTNGGNGCQ